MDFLRSVFNYAMRLAGAYIKHEVENTFHPPQSKREFNPDAAFVEPTVPPPCINVS
jgi:hypothetical protein